MKAYMYIVMSADGNTLTPAYCKDIKKAYDMYIKVNAFVLNADKALYMVYISHHETLETAKEKFEEITHLPYAQKLELIKIHNPGIEAMAPNFN